MNATTPSVAKEAENTTSAGDNSAHSDGRSRKNKCNSKKSGARTRNRIVKKRPLCYGHR